MNTLHSYLIVYGGQDNQGAYLNDVFVYHTAHNEWYLIFYNRFSPIIRGIVPRARSYHASTVIPNDQIVIFGGRTKEQKKIENIYILKPS